MTLRPVNNSAAGVAQRPRTGPALFKNEPPRSPVCTLAQTRQSRLSEGHCPRRAGADPEKRIPATVASKMLDAGDALGGVGRITFQMTSVSPRDSRDEALDRAARNRSSANRSRDALKPVIADRWTRRFVERSLNMHKNALTPEETCWKID
jgi:hypothetical protein